MPDARSSPARASRLGTTANRRASDAKRQPRRPFKSASLLLHKPPARGPSRAHRFRQDGIDAGWSSPVARQAHNLKVVGSNPTPATTLTC